MVFNDSWYARAAHPTAETMQMHMNLSFSMDQGPHQPIAHTMKMHENLHIFNDSEAARVPTSPPKPCTCLEVDVLSTIQEAARAG